MAFKLPASVAPLWNMLFHIAIGAVLLAGIFAIEVCLAGFVRLIGMLPFAPEWLTASVEPLEKGLFGLDLFVGCLFLAAEVAKLARGLWREIRNG